MREELHQEIKQLIDDRELAELFKIFFIKQSIWAFYINSINESIAKHNAETSFINSLTNLITALDSKIGHERGLEVLEEIVIPYTINPSAYLLSNRLPI